MTAVTTFTVTDGDGIEITVDRWSPPEGTPVVAVLHLLHGWAEHAGRYARFASAAAPEGIAVYANDHRGHGRTGLAAAGGLGDLGPGGMDGVLSSVRAVSDRAFADHPGVPRFLLGHSWGSFLAQRYIRRWADELAGAVLMGTTLRREGAVRRGGPNERFEPAATPYDWLSRDAAEVQRYIEDPWCGFERMTSQVASTPARSNAESRSPDDTDVPSSLPLLILNGTDDPIGGDEGGRALAEHYRRAGVRDVTLELYAGARHELLNETNREEVTADLLAWLAARRG